MKPPKRLRIGPHVYRVRYDRRALTHIEARGVCDTAALTIDIDGDLAPSAVAETILHESLHACFVFLDVDSEVEERVTRALAPALLAVLRDNPEMTDYLLCTGGQA